MLEFTRGEESQALLRSRRVVEFDELHDRLDDLQFGNLAVLDVALAEPAVEAFGLDDPVQRFHRGVVVANSCLP